ncbi:FG-GAP repeat domain-containing protein [Methylococcus capsulatus]|uniref:FG-GAP repeat domain-containing protein n=1 Tax=Methylococcus capsulatus TaxID=414 RepID=UPI001C52A348|nr:VCBS repeat-containing protein [Methylococcus capsulatus]QXP91772.1 VCBS repeat-containing protein [Methylococcus capsulatus]
MSRIILALVVALSVFLSGGCASRKAASVGSEDTSSFHQSLPFADSPFDILVDDVDGDGRPDIALVSHGDNYVQIFLQREGRVFQAGERQSLVGFHPGDLLRLSGARPRYLVAAEGQNKVLVLEPGPGGSLRQTGELKVPVPRHVASFRWPGWGDGVALTPFGQDFLVLLKNFDAARIQEAEQVQVALSEKQHSIRRAEWVRPVDVDGDGVDELLFASNTTQEVLMLEYPGPEGAIKPKLVAKFRSGAPWDVLSADLNGDGAIDLLVPNQSKPFVIHALLNDGHGNFQETAALPFPTDMGLRRFAWSKDKDGFGYLFGVGYGAVTLYRFPDRWDGKAPVPMRSVPVGSSEGSQDILLEDLDGDGWLDGVVGRGKGPPGAWIVYGPLWEHFEELSAARFVLN